MGNCCISCPKVSQMVSEENCKECEYKPRSDDLSTTICRYRIGRESERKWTDLDELRMLIQRARWMEEQMNRAYKRGKTTAAENYGWELGRIQKQIKKLKEALKCTT